MSESPIRLNRYLAMRGVAARRKADLLIAAGRVMVNGETPPPGGMLVHPGRDVVAVDGLELEPGKASYRYFAVNKPLGVISAVSDTRGQALVTDLVPERGLHPVGRLDKDSRGLVLLTDDGELSFRLQHPRHHVEKEYEVLVAGSPDDEDLERVRSGVLLEEGHTGPARVVVTGAAPGGTRLRVVIRQGWKRQLRRTFGVVKHHVIDLQRVRIGSLQLGDLVEGQGRPLEPGEVEALLAEAGISRGATEP